MSRKQQTAETNRAKVPAYIVTFSDMVTLLLTFFVMLLTLAHVRDPELFNVSRNTFIEYIENYGLGVHKGKKITPEFDNLKIKYFISSPEKDVSFRTIDAREEELRRIFKKISESMKTTPSQLVAKKANFSVTNINFSPGLTQLNEPAKRFLTQFATDLQARGQPQAIKLYVLGLATDAKNQQQQWILSARRAQAVSGFLNGILPAELQWPVYSWGAGPGGLWVGENSLVSEKSQILIAVLRGDD